MGMDLHLIGYRDVAEHDKHVEVWRFCKAKGVSLPKETAQYLGGHDLDDMNEETIERLLQVEIPHTEYRGE